MKDTSLIKDPGKLRAQDLITKQQETMCLRLWLQSCVLVYARKFGEVVPYKHQETASKAFKSHRREGSFLKEALIQFLS